MGLSRKLDEGDKALLEIIEDEIWCGEFLRSTYDGEPNKTLWPLHGWKYRDYQKMLLTDKSKYLVLTGGRAIGKCQPSGARIYTTEGYVKIGTIISSRRKYFTVFAVTPEGRLVQRRAVCVPDARASTYTIVTKAGHEITATANHPILTPDGYKLLMNLNEDDLIAIATWLPHVQNEDSLSWAELRILGYLSGLQNYTTDDQIIPRFAKIGAEFEAIADSMIVNWHKDAETGGYTFVKKLGPFKHPILDLMNQVGIRRVMQQRLEYEPRHLARIPAIIMTQTLENIKIYLEAYIAQYAEITARHVKTTANTKRQALELQELFLKFGIESSVRDATFTIDDPRALFKFWQQFSIPGVAMTNIKQPRDTKDTATDFMRFDPVVSMYKDANATDTFAIYVYQDNNYISDNIFVHNTVVLEDKIVYEALNSDIEFPETREEVLVTPNLAQMQPLLSKVVQRFTSGKLLKDYLGNRVNKTEGVLIFSAKSRPFTFRFRIAGSKSEQNMVKHKLAIKSINSVNISRRQYRAELFSRCRD